MTLEHLQTPEFISDIYDPIDLSPQTMTFPESPILPRSGSHDLPAHHVSPLTAVASSLAGWNGEPTFPTASLPSESSPTLQKPNLGFELGASTTDRPPSFPTPEESEPFSQYFGYFPADLSSHKTPIFATQQCLKSEPSPPNANAVAFYDELERARALHEYGIGLMEQVGVGPSCMGNGRAADELPGTKPSLAIGDIFPAFLDEL
jgi:hypothetical protein